MFRTPKNIPQMYGWSNLIWILPIHLLDCAARGHCASMLPSCSYPHSEEGLPLQKPGKYPSTAVPLLWVKWMAACWISIAPYHYMNTPVFWTFLLPVNMYLSKLGPIRFKETRLEIDIRPAWVCWCTVLDPDGVAEFRRRAYDSRWTLLSFVTKKLNFLMSSSWLAQEENPVLVNGPAAWRGWYYRASSYGFMVWP